MERRSGLLLEHRYDEDLGQVGGEPEHLRGGLVEHVVLGLHQDRADQAGEGRIHGDRHAVAHQAHRALDRGAVGGIETGDRGQHQDEADDGAEQAELHQRIAGERAELIGAPQCVRQPAQQQGLIEPVMPLQTGLENEVADMRGDLAGRQLGAVAGHHVGAQDPEARGAAAHQREHALGAVELARDRGGARQAVQRDRHVKDRDDDRNVGLVAGQHQVEEPVVPRQHEPESRHAGEHQPAQQRQVIGREFAFPEAYCHRQARQSLVLSLFR